MVSICVAIKKEKRKYKRWSKIVTATSKRLQIGFIGKDYYSLESDNDNKDSDDNNDMLLDPVG
ncbi:29174_t:CDS:2, partial [Gigaspora margarita]